MTSEPVFDQQIAAWFPAPSMRSGAMRRASYRRRLRPATWALPGALPLALLAWAVFLGLCALGGVGVAGLLALISDGLPQ